MTQARVKSSKLNLRDQPGTKAKVLGTLEIGTGLEILEENGEWLKVGVTGLAKWSSGFYKKAAFACSSVSVLLLLLIFMNIPGEDFYFPMMITFGLLGAVSEVTFFSKSVIDKLNQRIVELEGKQP